MHYLFSLQLIVPLYYSFNAVVSVSTWSVCMYAWENSQFISDISHASAGFQH